MRLRLYAKITDRNTLSGSVFAYVKPAGDVVDFVLNIVMQHHKINMIVIRNMN